MIPYGTPGSPHVIRAYCKRENFWRMKSSTVETIYTNPYTSLHRAWQINKTKIHLKSGKRQRKRKF